ncbi:uncharacterized protein LOC130903792 [Diorhabda carinulata]|uniref:uncharacterized protein LOC130903792 n=1 Tax=Diorhabda carinulata TaxID=1163345 RepID=UPI0025A1E9DC|nr:uncharacterized protein LOC130903792 [Diorhabda carinulata]
MCNNDSHPEHHQVEGSGREAKAIKRGKGNFNKQKLSKHLKNLGKEYVSLKIKNAKARSLKPRYKEDACKKLGCLCSTIQDSQYYGLGDIKRQRDASVKIKLEEKFIKHTAEKNAVRQLKEKSKKMAENDTTFLCAFFIYSSLQRRLFQLQLEDRESAEHTDLVLHTDVRWLSRGKFLQRFQELLPEITAFLDERGGDTQILKNEKWLTDLAFLTDITMHLNIVNLELQGKGKTIIEKISAVNAFKSKLQLMIDQLKRKDLKHFPSLKARIPQFNYDTWLWALKSPKINRGLGIVVYG